MFSIIAFVVEALLTNMTGVGRWYVILFIGMFSRVMFPLDVFSAKVFAAYLTGKAGGLTMNSTLVSLQMTQSWNRKSCHKHCTNASLWAYWEVVPPVS